MIVADPTFTAVIVGCVAGLVCPAGIVTLAGETVSFDVSLLERFTVTALPAADGSETVNVPLWLSARVGDADREIPPGAVTVTAAVVVEMFGVDVLAEIVAEPTPAGVIGTFTLFWFARMVTEAGTVAAAVLEEFSVNVMFDGAAVERVKERFWAPEIVVSVSVFGKKEAEPVTCTVVSAEP